MDNTFFTKEGKKVSLEEPFEAKIKKFDKNGKIESIYEFSTTNLTPHQAERLIKRGILSKVKPSEKVEKPSTEIDVNDVLDLIGKWIIEEGVDRKDVVYFLKFMPCFASFAVLMKATAIIIDRKYPNHIKDADVDKYFTLDMANGRVCEVPKEKIKNFKCFAAFRSIEDIKVATKMFRPLIKVLWPNE